ncbi:MAG: transglutaminase-like domain-containing protein [Thermoproteota archaeon]
MRRSSVIRIVVLTMVLFSIIDYRVGTSGEGEEYYYRLRMSFINNGSSDYITTLEDRLFTVFPNTSIQQVYIVETNPSVKRILSDEDGNLFAELNLPEIIEPGENITVTILIKITLVFRSLPQVSIDSSGNLFDIPVELANYTVSSGAWKYESEDSKYIADLAAQIKGNDTNVLRIICEMVEFIGNRVEYPSGEELRQPQYPSQTLPDPEGKGEGDCDDQSTLLITMLRSVGIPSYLQTGGVLSTAFSLSGETWDGHLTISSRGVGWHGWVEAYIPPWGWLPVDITYGYYSQRQNPLSSITYSASATEHVLESEKYSNIDFVAESLRTEERIKRSSVYLHVEEEVYAGSLFDNNLNWGEQLKKSVVLLILLLAILVIVLAVLYLLERRAYFKGFNNMRIEISRSTIPDNLDVEIRHKLRVSASKYQI